MRKTMSKTAPAHENKDQFTIDYNEQTKIIITRYGIARTSEQRLFSYATVRYSYHIKRSKEDRKSTRLNSSHLVISYAVFCLKKKKKHLIQVLINHVIICITQSV